MTNKVKKKTMSFIIYWQKFSCVLWFFGIEHIAADVLNKTKDKSITHNIFRAQSHDSIMCGFYCITFIEYMIAQKILLDYIYFFQMAVKRMARWYIFTLKTNMAKENVNLGFRLKK